MRTIQYRTKVRRGGCNMALHGTVATTGRGSDPAGRHRPRWRTGHAVVDLIDHARSGLALAAGSANAGERYAAAHLAALRAGAAVLAARSAKRAAAQAGLPRAVTAREADDMLRDAESFLGLVCALLGLPHQQPLTGAAVGLLGL